jgi:hypothetical protein
MKWFVTPVNMMAGGKSHRGMPGIVGVTDEQANQVMIFHDESSECDRGPKPL